MNGVLPLHWIGVLPPTDKVAFLGSWPDLWHPVFYWLVSKASQQFPLTGEHRDTYFYAHFKCFNTVFISRNYYKIMTLKHHFILKTQRFVRHESFCRQQCRLTKGRWWGIASPTGKRGFQDTWVCLLAPGRRVAPCYPTRINHTLLGQEKQNSIWFRTCPTW